MLEWYYPDQQKKLNHSDLFSKKPRASGSIMFIISLASTANFIGDDVKSSGFVYGVYSLSDKILNGVVVFVIQYIHPER
ncbi:hypothetical protein QYM36_003800 [Artemia franciscana]|uniref:Uncharacterized protein n=1 Tax=Artemia franciscana TaxID=6661 RepID=A0AA88L7U8_ARTSF|nr:hypothetical protein QYM36_003800 [Artemia franciscana]